MTKQDSDKPKKGEKLICIYGLYCPLTDRLMYIGKANDMQKRLLSHLRDSRRRKTPVYSWIRGLSEKGLVPIIKALEYVPIESWVEAETRLIAHYRGLGKLLNLADGGDQPLQTPEQRSNGGKAMNVKLANMPEKQKQLIDLKRRLGRIYNEAKNIGKKTGDWSWAEQRRIAMVSLADRSPMHCGIWSHLRYVTHLKEDGNGQV